MELQTLGSLRAIVESVDECQTKDEIKAVLQDLSGRKDPVLKLIAATKAAGADLQKALKDCKKKAEAAAAISATPTDKASKPPRSKNQRKVGNASFLFDEGVSMCTETPVLQALDDGKIYELASKPCVVSKVACAAEFEDLMKTASAGKYMTEFHENMTKESRRKPPSMERGQLQPDGPTRAAFENFLQKALPGSADVLLSNSPEVSGATLLRDSMAPTAFGMMPVEQGFSQAGAFPWPVPNRVAHVVAFLA